MSRIPKPRKWRDKFVTKAGGRMKVLCLIREGIVKARKELSKHLAELELREQEKVTRPDGFIYPSLLAECIADSLKFQQSKNSELTSEPFDGSITCHSTHGSSAQTP